MNSKVIENKSGSLWWMLVACALLLAAALSGCSRKDLPAPQNGTPVFQFVGEIGGQAVDMQAGVNGLYMYTDFYRDAQDLYTLRGRLSRDTCATCEPFLGLELRDSEPSVGVSLAAGLPLFFRDSSFASYSFDSVLQTSVREVFSFQPLNFYSGASYQWTFGDGSSSTSPAPQHQYNQEGIRTVSLAVNYQGQGDTLSMPIDVTPLSTCRTSFTATVDSSLQVVTVQSNNLSFASYTWDFGNGTSGSGIFDTVIYPMPGVYTIRLVASVGGCNSEFRQKVNLSNNPLAVLSNFSYEAKFITVNEWTARLNRHSAVWTWRQNGKTYRSYKLIPGLNQSNREVLRMEKVETYLPNHYGQATLKLQGSVDTYLYNEQDANDSIRIVGKGFVMGMAYPD